MHSSAPTPIGVRLVDIARDREDWREFFAWPVPFDILFEISHRLQRRFVDLLATLDSSGGNSAPFRRYFLAECGGNS